MDNVSFHCDMTEIMLKVMKISIQSVNQSFDLSKGESSKLALHAGGFFKLVAYRTSEQEVAVLIPDLAGILSED